MANQRIVIHADGTTGDILPAAAFAKALKDQGYDLRMVCNRALHHYPERLGLNTLSLTDIDRGPEEARQNAWSWNHWRQDPATHPKALPFDTDRFVLQVMELSDLCRSADLLISNSLRYHGYAVHQALGIPWMTFSVMPFNFWKPTSTELAGNQLRRDIREFDFFRHLMETTSQKMGLTRTPLKFNQGFSWASNILLGASPHFSRPALNQLAPAHRIHQSGFWFYEDPAWEQWRPDPDLERFFDCPPDRRPMVFGYSSIPLEDPSRILSVHVKAAQILNRPLLVQSGWAGFNQTHLHQECNPDLVKFVDFLPQDWLFANAGCAIQHGGIGSLARALRQGCPLLIEPMGNDQLYNATRVHDLGVGAAIHPFKVTVEGLVHVLRDQVLTPPYRNRAMDFAQKLSDERGLEIVCKQVTAFLKKPRSLIHAFLPKPKEASPPIQDGPSESPSIPRILHQLWKTNYVPLNLEKWRQSWISRHPDWDFYLWTDRDLYSFIRGSYPWFLPIFEGYPHPIFRADAARYFILYHFGGVYADLDMQCLKPLDPLLENKRIVLGLEPMEHVRKQEYLPHIVCNALMASVPGHPFWRHVFQELIGTHKVAHPVESTGPFFLTRAYDSFRDAENISLEPPEYFCPIHNAQRWDTLTNEERCRLSTNAYAVHHWMGSWCRPNREEIHPPQMPISVLMKGAPVLHSTLEIHTSHHLAFSDGYFPRVSCLMVTGGAHSDEKHAMALRAVLGFRLQSYPNKELVIVNDGPDQGLGRMIRELADERIIYVRLPFEGKPLGSLRNIAVEKSTGKYIAQWDDDDFSDPQRLASQIAAIVLLNVDACVLKRITLWWPTEKRLAISCVKAWENSLICVREKLPLYPNLPIGEDTPVMEDIISRCRVVLIDWPDYYTYVCHGSNSWGKDHFNMWWRTATRNIIGGEYEMSVQGLKARLRLHEIEAALPDWL